MGIIWQNGILSIPTPGNERHCVPSLIILLLLAGDFPLGPNGAVLPPLWSFGTLVSYRSAHRLERWKVGIPKSHASFSYS